MVCTFPSSTDIDNWGELGNPGWFFDDLAPYFKKFATYSAPSKDLSDFYNVNNILDKKLHKIHGEGVKTSFPRTKMVAAKEWLETFDNLGMSMTEDPQSGGGLGGFTFVAH
jgi:choline dehydrogenase